jgi:hypothetical protein
MVTAGHCFPQGAQVQQGYVDQANNTVVTTGVMGTVSVVEWGNNRPDAELISNGSYDPYVYRTLTASAGVDQTSSVMQGQPNICADGALTGENCTGVVSKVNGCDDIYYTPTSYYYVCGVDNATSSNGTIMIDPNSEGDSGGPVYTLESNGNLIANGVLSADLDNSSGVPDGKGIVFTDLYYLGYVIPGAASS